MAETQDTKQVEQNEAQEPQGTATPEPQGSGTTDWKAEARKWEERAKQNKARVAELEGKAQKYDELEEANKSDIERATEAATKASAEAADWKSKFEALSAERERELAVRRAASEYGVDVDMLMRMGGDVDENAKFLQGKEAARPKYGSMRDGGDQRPPASTLADELKGARNEADRIRIRAEHIARSRSRQ